jgi:hypothetical protein
MASQPTALRGKALPRGEELLGYGEAEFKRRRYDVTAQPPIARNQLGQTDFTYLKVIG